MTRPLCPGKNLDDPSIVLTVAEQERMKMGGREGGVWVGGEGGGGRGVCVCVGGRGF